ncbi:alcohol dehydrogenase [Scheffersomyces xylosifermentans]|uniref:alcohol dehydrogenase n=1 Tax=Scheffersomyces xylosifermentans TaxID=1304137 RepID=UPI00315C8D90
MSTTSAIIAYNSADGKNINWKYKSGIKVREDLKDHEVLVDMHSVGLCHSDIFMGVGDPDTFPRILGHEGTGYVAKVGSKVTSVEVGDPVILSFTYCDECSQCKAGYPGYCYDFIQKNLLGTDTDVTYTLDGEKVGGKFFGQSSFAKRAVVNDTSVVNVKSLNIKKEDLAKFGPLGCGFQTGAGSIYYSGDAKAGESCVVYGLGGVGFAGIMAAKIAGCNPIIGVDTNERKFELAKKLGCTHTIKAGTDEEVHDQIVEITGHGADLSFECIGGSRFVQNAINNANNRGKIVYVGVASFTETIEVPSLAFMTGGKKLIGSTEGDAHPQKFIPKMIEWHSKGQFPVEDLQKFYKIEDFQKAVDDMKNGNVIKPILMY